MVPPMTFPGPRATRRRWAAALGPYVEAIRHGDEAALLASLERLAASHRLLAPLALAIGGVAMLLGGIRLLFVNWRLTLVQVLPALWIWAAMYDLRIHVIRDGSAVEISGPALVPIGLAIAAVTAACFFLNAVFAFAVASAEGPTVRSALAEAAATWRRSSPGGPASASPWRWRRRWSPAASASGSPSASGSSSA
jgi:hypothetical protein